jgi:hypothetical protein
MKLNDLQQFVDREPFHRFSVRLSNGARYDFETQRDIGAAKDYSTLVYFGDRGLVLIDAENIVEVFDNPKD